MGELQFTPEKILYIMKHLARGAKKPSPICHEAQLCLGCIGLTVKDCWYSGVLVIFGQFIQNKFSLPF